MISSGFKTDRGTIRDLNEDAVFVLPEQNLYMVADGVGGRNSGELASRMAVGFIASFAELNPVSEISDLKELRIYFKTCFEGANRIIFDQAQNCEQNSGMATTSLLCYIREDNAFFVNVGDSRAYLFRDGCLTQLTEDHTCVQELVNQGLLSKEEAEYHPDRHKITRAVGGEPEIKPDFFLFKVQPGDRIVLCTDGLYGEVPEERMGQLIAKENSMRRLSANLVSEANRMGGGDNITVVCIRIH